MPWDDFYYDWSQWKKKMKRKHGIKYSPSLTWNSFQRSFNSEKRKFSRWSKRAYNKSASTVWKIGTSPYYWNKNRKRKFKNWNDRRSGKFVNWNNRRKKRYKNYLARKGSLIRYDSRQGRMTKRQWRASRRYKTMWRPFGRRVPIAFSRPWKW